MKNYRPVSVLPAVSKIFERVTQKQINEYISQFLSLFLCGYRKGFSTQTSLVWLIEKWKYQLDKDGFPVALLMHVSKVFDKLRLINSETLCIWFWGKCFRFSLYLLEK